MKKYIDADELLKEAEKKEGAYGYVSVEQIAAFPAADVAEVVRCKDCVHRDPEDKRCDCGGHELVIGKVLPVEDEWFCADGKKMDEVGE